MSGTKKYKEYKFSEQRKDRQDNKYKYGDTLIQKYSDKCDTVIRLYDTVIHEIQRYRYTEIQRYSDTVA